MVGGTHGHPQYPGNAFPREAREEASMGMVCGIVSGIHKATLFKDNYHFWENHLT